MTTYSESETSRTLSVIEQFNDAFNRRDVDAVMTLLTDDVIFENTSPFPDGKRLTGQSNVRAFWASLFASTPDAHFAAEDLFAVDDRCTVRWRYSFTSSDGTPGHVRGVDVFKVRDGKVSEKFAYVKG